LRFQEKLSITYDAFQGEIPFLVRGV